MSQRQYKVLSALYGASPQHSPGLSAGVRLGWFTLIALQRKGYVNHGRNGWYLSVEGRKAFLAERATNLAKRVRREMIE